LVFWGGVVGGWAARHVSRKNKEGRTRFNPPKINHLSSGKEETKKEGAIERTIRKLATRRERRTRGFMPAHVRAIN